MTSNLHQQKRVRTTHNTPSRFQIGKRCEHKLRYRSRWTAWKSVGQLFGLGFALQRIYRCPWCKGWHATTDYSRNPDLSLLAGVMPIVRMPVHDTEADAA